MLLTEAAAIALASNSIQALARARIFNDLWWKFCPAIASAHAKAIQMLSGLTLREHARGRQSGLRIYARRSGGGRRSPSRGGSAISLLERGRKRR